MREITAEVMKMAFSMNSPAFHDAQTIPQKYSGEGGDISPRINWSDLPGGTRELALICEDPDAPTVQPFVHWVVYKISPKLDSLPEGVPSQQSVKSPVSLYQGMNSFDRIGYNGPMPPQRHGRHRYFFKLYALDQELQLEPGAAKDELMRAIEGHVIEHVQFMGTYERH